MRVLKARAARRIFRRAFVSSKKVYKTDGRRIFTVLRDKCEGKNVNDKEEIK